MAGWRRICCAVDFGEPSRLAMLEAAELAARFGAELWLVHVHAPPVLVATDMLVAPRAVAEMAAVEAERTLAGWRGAAERITRRTVRTQVLAGDAARELVRFARAEGFDLVVLATHGRRGLRRVVLGSVAEHVVREAPCEVLVVRRPTRLEPVLAEDPDALASEVAPTRAS
jgi:nucleotide-binding universal stress UspA family protein